MGPEKGLLGIRILDSDKRVFARFGAPTQTFLSSQMINVTTTYGENGLPTGDITSVAAGGSVAGRTAGFGGMGRGLGGGGFRPGMAGGGMPGGGMAPGGGMGAGRGLMPGGSRGLGGGAPAGLQGAGAGGSGADETFAQSHGFIWVYLDAKAKRLSAFIFNSDKRVEGIEELGRSGGDLTSRGIGLGSPVAAVYSAFGWPDSMEQQGNVLMMDYGTQHVKLALVNNRVIGILVVLREGAHWVLDFGNGPSGGMSRGGPGGLGPGAGRRGGLMGRGMPGAGGGMGAMGGGMPAVR
jgi:hypothetical protein